MQKTKRNIVDNLEALGEAIGYDGYLLKEFRAAHPGVTPEASPQGRHSVPEWQAWLKAGGAEQLDNFKAEGGSDLVALRKEKMREEIRRLKLDNDQTEGVLSDPSEQVRLFALAVQSIDRGMDELVMRLAPKVVGCKDEVDAKLLIEEEVAKLKVQLGGFRFEEDAA